MKQIVFDSGACLKGQQIGQQVEVDQEKYLRAAYQPSNHLGCCLTYKRAGKLRIKGNSLAEAAEPKKGPMGELLCKLSRWALVASSLMGQADV